jgi:hypothetical protein
MSRQSNISALIVLAAALAGATTVSAQSAPGAPTRPAAPQLAPRLSSKPYARLFDQHLSGATAAVRSMTRPDSARRFICSMPVLPSDAAIDPTFERQPDTTTHFSMRMVPPPVCR